MRLMANYFDHLLSLDTPTYTVAQIAKRFEPSTVLWAFHTIQPTSSLCLLLYFSLSINVFLVYLRRLVFYVVPSRVIKNKFKNRLPE